MEFWFKIYGAARLIPDEVDCDLKYSDSPTIGALATLWLDILGTRYELMNRSEVPYY